MTVFYKDAYQAEAKPSLKENQGYQDRKVIEKQNQQKDQIQKHFRVLARNLDASESQQSQKVRQLEERLEMAEKRKAHTQDIVTEMQDKVYQSEKERLMKRA